MTEQREAQRESGQIAQRLNTILESTTDSVLLLDKAWTIQYLNLRARNQILNGKDLVGQNFWEAFPEAVETPFYRMCTQAMEDRQPAVIEDYYQSLALWMEVHAFPSEGGLTLFVRDVSERHLAEKTLHEAADELKAASDRNQRMLDYSLDMFCITDTEGIFVEVSRAAQTILGYDPRQLIGLRYLDLVHPEDRERTRAAELEMLAGKSTAAFENRMRRADGQYVRILWSAVWLEDDDQVFSVARDITRAVTAQTALRESEESLRFVLDSAALSYWDLDFSTGQIRRSLQHDQLFGYKESRDSFTAEDFFARVHPDDRQHVREVFAAAGQDNREFQYEFRVIWPDGSVHWLWCVGRAYLDVTGSPLRASGVIRNITKRKGAEEALEASEQRYRLLFNCNPQPVWVYDRESLAFLAVNPAAMRTYLYTQEEFLSMTIRDIRPPEDVPALYKELATPMVTSGEDRVTWRHITKDGRTLFVTIRSHALTFLGRDARLVVATDVSERIKLDERLLQVQKMEALGQLAGGIAHDFNNLLTVINGYASILEQQLPSGHESRRPVKYIIEAGHRAAAMTNQLLAFSRNQVLQPEVIQINRVIDGMVPLLRRLISEDIEIRIKTADDLGAVKADPVQMEQVILNLAINARDAMPKGGQLTIETHSFCVSDEILSSNVGIPSGHYVSLTISDNGLGMSPQVRARIFEPFFTTKEKGRGTGLGLPTVYGIIKQSSGHISVYSEENAGTSFKIYLPRVAGIPETGRGDRLEQLMDPHGTETVLVVEDDDDVRLFTITVLKNLGYQVIEERGAPEAIVAAENYQSPIHLMLTDVSMPKMNGRDLADFLAPRRPDMKVLFVSGHAENAIISHGTLDPGLFFLPKPFTSAALANKVRQVLDAPSRKKKVLVIDDESAVRDLFRHALESSQYEVVESANGNSAAGLLQKTPVDLVITDLVMPDKEGLETVRELRRDFPHVRILAVSGAGGGQYLKVAKILGADRVMTKPVSLSDLLERVKELIG